MLKKSFSMLEFSKRLLISRSLACDRLTQEKLLMEPFEYLQKLPCKHHTLMAPAFNHWLQVPEDKLDGIQKACRSWVTWSFLLDDIQDDSPFRYGMPAAHRVYGVGVTINAANQTLLLVQKQMIELGHPLAQQVFTKRIEQYIYEFKYIIYIVKELIYIGKTKPYSPLKRNILTWQKIVCIIKGFQTGAYFGFPVDLLQLFSSNETDYTGLAVDIGSYYELLDDYYNLLHPKALPRLANEKQENHVLCSDITEGKITLAIIHASQFPDVATELANILKQRTSDPKLQNRVIKLVKKHGSDEYTRNKLKKFEADIRAQIDQLRGNPILTAFMDELSIQSYEHPPEQDLYS